MSNEETKYQLKLLGIPSINQNNEVIHLSYKKAEAVLYYLAIKRYSTRDEIIELLWQDSPVDRARANLRNALYVIRKALGEDVILSESKEYLSFNSDAFSNIDLYSWMETSNVELYTGPLLDGFTMYDDYAFENWLVRSRQYYKNIYSKQLEDAISSPNISYNKLRNYLQKIIAIEPYNESAYRRLMLLNAKDQNLTEVIALYNNLKNKLDIDFNTEPSAETSSLFNYLIHTDNALSEVITSKKSFFAGRDEEIQILYHILHKTKFEEHTHFVSVIGDAGSGKSRLIEEWLRSIKALDNSLMIRFLYHTEPRLCLCNKVDHNLNEQQLIAMIKSTNQFKYLFLDNLQWLKEENIETIKNIITQLEKQNPLMILCTSRYDISKNQYDYLRYLLPRASTNNIELKPIENIYLRQIVDNMKVNNNITNTELQLLYQRCGRNIGLFVDQLSLANKHTGLKKSRYIKYFCESQLYDLNSKELSLLEDLSFFQNHIPLSILPELTGLNITELTSILDKLTERNLLNEAHDKNNIYFSFRYRILRRYLYNKISLVRRKHTHETIGELFETMLKHRLDDLYIYPQIIYHYTHSDNTYDALKYNIKMSHQFS